MVIGSATDPYQPAERHFRITRRILDVLTATRGLRIGINTKRPLVTRDVDVLARLSVRGSLSVHVSLITVDRELARRLDPLRASSRRRYLPLIGDSFPELLSRYERTYASSAYAAERYRRGLSQFMHRLYDR